MASDTVPTLPSGTRFLPSAQVHCRPSEGQQVQQHGQQLLTTQSLWKCDSHRTKGCPVNLKRREKRNRKGYPDGLHLQHSLSCDRCCHTISLTNEDLGGTKYSHLHVNFALEASNLSEIILFYLYFPTSTPNTNLYSLI